MSEVFTTFGKRLDQATPAQHFLLAAITRGAPLGAFQFPLDVKMTVNGVDIPFSDALENIYERFNRQCDERIEQIKADMVPDNDMISLSKLRGMSMLEVADLLTFKY